MPVPEKYYMFVLMGICVLSGSLAGKYSRAMNCIFAGFLFIAGTLTSLPSYGQYNLYETQAGPVILTPPRHHKPPKGNPLTTEDDALKKIDKQPEFPGGAAAIFAFISKNLKYPLKAQILKLQGKVYVGLTVKTDGSVDNVSAMRGIGSGCDEEAVRVVRLMPKWKPAVTSGKPVEVSLVIPVKFELDTLNVKPE